MKIMKLMNEILKINVITLFILYVISGNIGPALAGLATGFYFTVWFIDYLNKKYRKNDDG